MGKCSDRPDVPDAAASHAAAFDLHPFLGALGVRPKALIQTLWGDSVVPYGGVASLSSLVRLGSALEINERLTRMSMFRLAKDGWFESSRVGRLSFYRMSDEQLQRFQSFQPKVYEPPEQTWDGTWHFVIFFSDRVEDRLQSALGWLGLGRLGEKIFLCPGDRLSRLVDVLRFGGRLNDAQIFEATAIEALPTLYPELIRQAWRLDQLASEYRDFSDRFRPALDWVLRCSASISTKDSFVLRTLLVHEWRRLALRDPRLPVPLMPEDWPGPTAFLLTRNLYQQLLVPSEHYLSSELETPEGPAIAPALSTMSRFGGLTWPWPGGTTEA